METGVLGGCCVPVARVQQLTEPAGETAPLTSGILLSKSRTCWDANT